MDYWHTMLAKISSLYSLSAPVALRNEAFNGSSSTSMSSLWWFKTKISFQDINHTDKHFSVSQDNCIPCTWAKEYMRAVLSDLGQDHEWITSIEDDRFENQTSTLICYKVNFNSNDLPLYVFCLFCQCLSLYITRTRPRILELC